MCTLICGPKLAACGIMLSTWGVIMLTYLQQRLCIDAYSTPWPDVHLFRNVSTHRVTRCVAEMAMLGIFFTTHSALLIEDVPLTSGDFNDTNPPQKVFDVYDRVGYNCFIASAIYTLIGAFSCYQMKLNRQKEYLVH